MKTHHISFRRKKRLWPWLALAGVLAAVLLWIFVAAPAIERGRAQAEAHAPETEQTPPPENAQASESAQTPEQTADQQPAQDEADAARGERNLYEAVIDIYPDEERLEGRLRLTYVNRSKDSLYYILLNLWPNAVKADSLIINDLTLSGESSDFTLSGDGVYLKAPLVNELAPGESVVMYMEYSLDIPEQDGRLGIKHDFVMLGGAMPIAAAYENGAWREDVYIEFGDSFVSDISDYKVVVSAPGRYALAATGSVTEQREEDDRVLYYLLAPQVREFAMALVKDGRTASVMCGETEVVCMATSTAKAEFGAAAAADALAYFSANIGMYPYKRFCVTEYGGAGGMEYPNLVMIWDDAMEKKHRSTGLFIIAHEAAHQWWYGVVGSDQVNAPWIDEALTEYMGYKYMKSVMEDEEDFERIVGVDLTMHETEGYERKPLNAPLSSFTDVADYAATVYSYGASVFRELDEKLGEETFFEALSIYYNDNHFKRATKEALVAAFSEAAGEDLTDWFDSRM